ncbi:MAG: hypothetical protein FD155_2766 [Bacteroidetes bacterium]|nr:MAG: hypothetical protein FD155_2766 [Bacteroidota bacterium]
MKVIKSNKHSYPKYGQLHTIHSFPSIYTEDRRIDVWIPEGYDPEIKHSVLYMHDGQNLFNPAMGFHGQIWAIDAALQPLMYQARVKPTIVVAIWNTHKRYQEYLPAPAFDLLPQEMQDYIRDEHNYPDLEPLSDGYLDFIVHELKPYIDQSYPTLSCAEHTSIMGSSMGGLISAYAIAKFPHIFGNAGCVSTHWPLSLHVNELSFSEPFINWLMHQMPDPATHRIYFDFGTATIDSYYEIHQQRVDTLMRESGYVEGLNWITVKDEGAPHSEEAWKNRVHMPLAFLLRH